MVFFTGEYGCKLDTKGRLVLPARIKADLLEGSTKLVIRKGFDPDPYLILYPISQYKKIHEKISSLNEFNPEQRRLKRNIFRDIVQVELDSVSRILIPKIMIDHAHIQKDARLVGQGKCIEIWNPEIFGRHLITDPKEYSELAQKFLDGENA